MTLKQKQKMLGNGENLWVHPLDNRDLLDVSNRSNLGTNANLKSEMSSSFLLFNLSFIANKPEPDNTAEYRIMPEPDSIRYTVPVKI